LRFPSSYAQIRSLLAAKELFAFLPDGWHGKENKMKRSSAFVAAALLTAAIPVSGHAEELPAYDWGGVGGWRANKWWPGYAGMGWAFGWNYPWWGYPYYVLGYDSPYGYGYPNGYSSPPANVAVEPVVAARSVADGPLGNTCTTPVKACELRHASQIGNGCSCRVPGGRARGSVTP
jgi:hypothetical protein